MKLALACFTLGALTECAPVFESPKPTTLATSAPEPVQISAQTSSPAVLLAEAPVSLPCPTIANAEVVDVVEAKGATMLTVTEEELVWTDGTSIFAHALGSGAVRAVLKRSATEPAIERLAGHGGEIFFATRRTEVAPGETKGFLNLLGPPEETCEGTFAKVPSKGGRPSVIKANCVFSFSVDDRFIAYVRSPESMSSSNNSVELLNRATLSTRTVDTRVSLDASVTLQGDYLIVSQFFGRVFRQRVDGSDELTQVESDPADRLLGAPSGEGLIHTEQHVYWPASPTGDIRRVDKKGNCGTEIVANGRSLPRALVLVRGELYWLEDRLGSTFIVRRVLP